MSWLYTTLCDRVRNKEEVEFAINYFGLLNKTLVNISTLRRIINKLLTVAVSLLEESLANSLIDDDKGNFWRIIIFL